MLINLNLRCFEDFLLRQFLAACNGQEGALLLDNKDPTKYISMYGDNVSIPQKMLFLETLRLLHGFPSKDRFVLEPIMLMSVTEQEIK